MMRAFLVTNKELRICTVIGAENTHHAGNKATKLWGMHWDAVEPVNTAFLYPKYLSLREFNKQIKELSQLKEKETNSKPPL